MKTLNSSIIYLASSIIEKGMAFLLIPFYTSHLNTTDYGVLSILQSLVAVMIIFFTFSLNGAASRFHFDGSGLYRRLHYGNIFLSITLISILFGFIFYLFSNLIFSFLDNIPTTPYIYLVIIIAYGNSIFSLYQLKLQMEQRAAQYAIYSIIKFLISASIAIFLILFFHKKADGVLEGMAVSVSLLLIFIFFKLFQEKIKLNFNKKLFKRNIKYSIYLVPHNLSSIFMSFLDRFFITTLINLSQTGIYTLGLQISAILGIFASAINNATVPAVLKAYKEKNYLYLIELTNISIIIISVIAMFLSLFSPEIIALVSPIVYKNAYTVVPFLTFYFVVQMYYFMTSSVLFYDTKATKFVPVATGLSLLLNFVLNYFFIGWWGIIGAAIATLTSIIIVNYIVIFMANKYIVVGFNHLKIHLMIIYTFFISNINFIVDINITFKLLLFMLSFLILLYAERHNSLLFNLKRKISEKINS